MRIEILDRMHGKAEQVVSGVDIAFFRSPVKPDQRSRHIATPGRFDFFRRFQIVEMQARKVPVIRHAGLEALQHMQWPPGLGPPDRAVHVGVHIIRMPGDRVCSLFSEAESGIGVNEIGARRIVACIVADQRPAGDVFMVPRVAAQNVLPAIGGGARRHGGRGKDQRGSDANDVHEALPSHGVQL